MSHVSAEEGSVGRRGEWQRQKQDFESLSRTFLLLRKFGTQHCDLWLTFLSKAKR